MIIYDLKNHKPLREIVYEELKRQILIGEIPPGTRMMEVDLAEKMDVSRTPVREAIRKLEKEGLVTIEARKGAYASDISFKDMIDILEVRETLESMAAALAASKMSDDDKVKIQEVIKKYHNAVDEGNVEEIIKLDEEFHKLIVNCSGNKTLIQMVSQVQELALRFRYIYYDDFRRFQNQPREHEDIFDALNAGDSEKARLNTRSHISHLKEFVKLKGEEGFAEDSIDKEVKQKLFVSEDKDK